ncbi:MAG: TAXI family TRAP transporter solute-binding subunit [Vicinamibacterales bacterium]
MLRFLRPARRHRCPRLDGALRLALFLLLVTAAGCGRAPGEAPPTQIVIAVGATDGVFQTVGDALAAAYNRVPGIHARTLHSFDSQTSAEAIERAEVDLALEGARTSYLAYRRGTPAYQAPHASLRAMAVLFPTVVHVIARRQSGIRTVADLRGRRVFVGAERSPTEAASRVVLESYGLTFRDIQPVFDRDHVVDEFRSGQIDGIIVFYPMEHVLAATMMGVDGAVLIPMDADVMEPIRSRDPLLRPASIPKATYPGQSEAVLTVGTDVLLVARKGLPEDLVYTLTKTLFESADDLSRAHRAARYIDPDRAPEAPIPLHRGAARYYRERELFR